MGGIVTRPAPLYFRILRCIGQAKLGDSCSCRLDQAPSNIISAQSRMLNPASFSFVLEQAGRSNAISSVPSPRNQFCTLHRVFHKFCHRFWVLIFSF